MIKNKINNVQDDLCEDCFQCWNNECRAYQVTHSEEERKHRQIDSRSFCEIPIFKWGYKPGMKLNPKEV